MSFRLKGDRNYAFIQPYRSSREAKSFFVGREGKISHEAFLEYSRGIRNDSIDHFSDKHYLALSTINQNRFSRI
jgi:hypothetical protein